MQVNPNHAESVGGRWTGPTLATNLESGPTLTPTSHTSPQVVVSELCKASDGQQSFS